MVTTWLSWLNYWKYRAGWAARMRGMAQHGAPFGGRRGVTEVGTGAPSPPHPLCHWEELVLPLWPPQRWPPPWPFPSLRLMNLWWWQLPPCPACQGGSAGTHWATGNLNAVQIPTPIPCNSGTRWYRMHMPSSLGCVSYPQMKVWNEACNAHPGTKDRLGVMIFPPRIHVRLPSFKGRRGWCA